jgi:hypothetical protein
MFSWSLLFVLLLFSTSDGIASSDFLQPWPRYSNPAIMDVKFEKNLLALPLNGTVLESKKYWSSDYWPLSKGNINFRWNAPVPTGFNLVSPNFDEALRMSQKELATLSPSEKFDLYNGQYSYPLKNEVNSKSLPTYREWFGICNGWAAAALNHAEPYPKVVSNPDGLQIPFGSSDIKALLSYYYAYHYKPVTTHQMGKRCNGRWNCADDMNAGAFHIVLTNRVGLEGKSFISDIDNGHEVWNQVVHSYKSEVIQKDLPPSFNSTRGTASVVRVKTTMKVVFNIVKNSWSLVNGTELQTFRDNEYVYDLDLDTHGKIIGGEWRSKLRPDFLWTVAAVSQFSPAFSKLKVLLND